MRKNLIIPGVALLLAFSFSSCQQQADTTGGTNYEAATVLTTVKTTQFFSDEKLAVGDMEKILSAGVNAPSAMNTQPWHFTAVTDEEMAGKLSKAMRNMKPPMMNGDGADRPPMMPEDGEPPMPPEGGQMPEGAPKPPEGGAGFSRAAGKAGIGDAPLTVVISCIEGEELSAGLAVQNMSAEAQLLGYGTKIMTAPTMALNTEEYKTMLKVPDGQKIAAVLLVGKPASEEDNPDVVSAATTRNAYDDMVTVLGN